MQASMELMSYQSPWRKKISRGATWDKIDQANTPVEVLRLENSRTTIDIMWIKQYYSDDSNAYLINIRLRQSFRVLLNASHLHGYAK